MVYARLEQLPPESLLERRIGESGPWGEKTYGDGQAVETMLYVRVALTQRR